MMRTTAWPATSDIMLLPCPATAGQGSATYQIEEHVPNTTGDLYSRFHHDG